MNRTNPDGIGSLRRLRASRWFGMLAIMALMAAMLVVPVGASADGVVAHITVTPSTERAVTGSTQTWTATATDSSNDPIAGVQLTYSVTGHNPTANGVNFSGLTNSSGQATFSYTGTNAGQDNITVFDDLNTDLSNDNGEIFGSATVDWESPAYITLTPPSATHSTGSAVQMTATVTDSGLQGLAGVSVNYTITGTHSTSGTITTGTNGSATFSDFSNVSGTDTVTVSTASLSKANTIQWIYGGGNLQLTPSNTAPALNSTESIHLNLEDSQFDPIAGVPVYFTVTGTNYRTGSGTTDVSGNATFSYSGSTVGQDTITAYADFDRSGTQTAGDPSNTTYVNWGGTGGSNGTNLTLSPSSQNAAPDNSASLTATFTNSNGGVYGVPVRYSVSGANATSGTAITNIYGEATISYVGHYSSTDTVTAYADMNDSGQQDSGEPSATATVVWGTGGVIGLSLSPSTQNAFPGTSASVTATYTNPYTNVSGDTVRYTITGANSASGSVGLNASGQATISYTGNNLGTDTIAAYVDLNVNGYQDSGEPSATATVVRTNTAFTLAPAHQIAATESPVSLTGTYTKQSGSPSGAIVRYSISGANHGSGALTTNSNGQVTITYTGVSAGTDTVSAYVDLNDNGVQDSGEPSATATVAWSGTAYLALSPADQSPALGNSATVTATLTSNNTAISGVPVRYVISGVNGRSGTVTSSSGGTATITYTGTNAGTDYVWAYADLNSDGVLDGGEPTSTVTVSWSTSGTTTPPPTSTALAAAQPTSAKAGCTYFVATQHNLCAGFAAYWNKFGGLAIFGMPITEEFQENGLTVQYFERARFEWHPGAWPSHYDVELGLVGDEVTAGRQAETPFMPTSASGSSDCTFYAATGHNLCSNFQTFWEQNGGLATFGYPISEEFQEKNLDTGQTYTVQYFQRGRFEWHPGSSPTTSYVELGRLGAQDFAMKYGISYY